MKERVILLKAVQLLLSRIGFVFYLIWRVFVQYSRRYFLIYSLCVVLILVIVIKYTIFPPYQNPEVDPGMEKTVLIPRGASLREIANILNENEILTNKTLFILLGKISGHQNHLQAGLFHVPHNLHPWHLLKYLTKPELADIKVTLPEGITTSKMAGILKHELNVDSTRFMHLVVDSIFCKSLGVSVNNLEGYLLPETYFFHYGMKEDDIIKLLVENTMAILDPDTVQLQISKLGMNNHEILTLASIVEGEVVVDSERVLVSSVYHNRLRRRWHLAADPTIQYIIPGPPRRLLKKHLEINSPYNTYKYIGLPPGPINNPGRNSILAAIFPAETRYMYFVASGDGGHHFSKTSSEHAYWKAKFDKVRREVRRNQRYNSN